MLTCACMVSYDISQWNAMPQCSPECIPSMYYSELSQAQLLRFNTSKLTLDEAV